MELRTIWAYSKHISIAIIPWMPTDEWECFFLAPMAFWWYGRYATNIDKVVQQRQQQQQQKTELWFCTKKCQQKVVRKNKMSSMSELVGWNGIEAFAKKGVYTGARVHIIIDVDGEQIEWKETHLHRHKLKIGDARETHALNSQNRNIQKISMSVVEF